MSGNAEQARLREARTDGVPWRKWGPYLSERQWGTVREDYSEDGDAWKYFSHDQARSRAYRWGEDGLAGISDDKQTLCFALALWNGQDPIIKERLFGLTNGEGNHGEDVKEYYFYLDSTPTHSYLKYLYKYPQRAFPYDELVAVNEKRSRNEPEYELIDTKAFDQDRYFDVFVEYAKAAPEDILIRITVTNRGSEAALLHVLPTLWFRNTWSADGSGTKPLLKDAGLSHGARVIHASQHALGDRQLHCEGAPALLFTENETNNQRLFGSANPTPCVKDGINDFLVAGFAHAVNAAGSGTKASAHYLQTVSANRSTVIRLRLAGPNTVPDPFGPDFDRTFELRQREADEFYRALTPPSATRDEALVIRQALAGMLWSKQYYFFDASRWLTEHHVDPLAATMRGVRNQQWNHMLNDHVISMPDKWEYPWYAAWDLAFHCIALASVDADFAREQLDLMLREMYMHPCGQIPAYEWNFSDVNPPVHAWATLFIHRSRQALGNPVDLDFLKRAFHKLSLNFGWWVNRKDRLGKNVFEGGFLGLDNIGVFDRSAPLPTGGYLEQADATAWIALFCQNMMEIAVELAAEDASYQQMCTKFAEHFLWIAAAVNRSSDGGMWDEEDGFYYDVLRLPDGSAQRLKVRSMVGLLPLCATTVFEDWQRKRMPQVTEALAERLRRMPELMKSIHATGPGNHGVDGRGMLALVNRERLHRILTRMLDEREFLSPYGLRALSRHHLDHPYVFSVAGQAHRVQYLPAESDSGMFGGNSNWRGPIWMPVNVLIIRSLLQYYLYYGDDFRIECPTGSGRLMNLFEVSRELAARLARIFVRGPNGHRPVFGGTEKFQTDPHWRDCILFYEYFHGDNGAGIGASHQTGWTGLVAALMQLFGVLEPQRLLEAGKRGVFRSLPVIGACLGLMAQRDALADAGNPLADHVSVGVGTFLLSTSTRVTVDGTARNGTAIDAEQDLGLEDADRFRVDAYWRFFDRHKIRLMYFDTNQSAERTIDRDLQVGDTIYPLDARLEATMETRVTEVAYEYAFLRRENYEVTGSFGVHNLSFKLGLSATQTGSSQTLSLQNEVDADGPLPVIGLRGIWRMNEKWYLDAQAQFFRISMDPYDGRIEDYSAAVVWMPFKHFGMGAGYNHFVTRVDVSSPRFEGDLRWTYGGARVFLTASF